MPVLSELVVVAVGVLAEPSELAVADRVLAEPSELAVVAVGVLRCAI